MTIKSMKSKQQGMTLLEILIALTLGAFLLGGVIHIFINSNRSYRMQENLSRMQENGRFALDFIRTDVRMADYRECFSDASVANAVSGTNDVGANNVDSITVTQKTNTCGNPNATATTIYTIQAGSNGLGLFRDTTGVAQELIEGVENMQIVYGEDTDADGTPNYYVPAGTAGLNMAQVVSVRVSLLIRSSDDLLTSQPIAYTYNGVATTPADRRLRRVFSSTITLRNRLQ